MCTIVLSWCTVHTFYLFVSFMSTLAAFCMHFMSKSVLIRSVHHYGTTFGQKCRIVHKECTQRKHVQNKILRVHTVHTVHTFCNFCVHFL